MIFGRSAITAGRYRRVIVRGLAVSSDSRGAALAGGLALGLAAAWNIANVGPAASTVADAYGISLGAVGFLTTALFLTHFAAQIPGGRIVDRLGARRVGFVSLALIVVGNLVALAAPSFPLALAEKDTRLVLEAAETHGTRLPLTETVRAQFRRAIELGHAEEDMAATFYATAD
jgi:hypothetical protein